MAAETITAGTLAAAVLEHQGFLAQANILDNFTEFFKYGGGLLYLLAAVGGIVSMVMYGSFRAAKFLIIGPALFWFMVVPRAEDIRGVAWKLGGGIERGLRASDEGTQKLQEDLVEMLNQGGQKVGEGPKIALGYWLFAKPIADFAEKFVDLMLKFEDGEDLLVSSRVEALEQLTSAMPHDSQFVQRIEEGFLVQCQKMFLEAHAAASLVVKNKVQNGVSEPSPAYRAEYDDHIAKMTEYATSESSRFNPEGTGFDKLIAAHARAAKGNKRGGSALADSLKDKPTISCADGWSLLAEEMWWRAGVSQAKVVRAAAGRIEETELALQACKEVVDKSVGTGEDQCDLRPAIVLATVNLRFAQSDALNNVYQRHRNAEAHKNPDSHVILTPLYQTGLSAAKYAGMHLLKRNVGLSGESSMALVQDGFNAWNNRRTRMDTPMKSITVNMGQRHAQLVSTRMYEISRYRQEIYAYAMHIPYYQGLLLYFLAILYPFFSMLLIIPGKASQFLNLPLAYLWVKSWDVGLAAIITLDKVLFNLLPSANVAPSLRQGPWNRIEQLPEAIAEAFNYDPLGSVYNYYSVLAFVWLSVPIITGYFTLKARSSMLSSFSSAASDEAKSSGGTASQVFSMKAQNERTEMLKALTGFAKRSTAMNGLDSGLRASVGNVYGLTAALGASAGEVSKAVLTENGKGLKLGEGLRGGADAAIDTWAKAQTSYLAARTNTVLADAQLHSQFTAVFDPNIGRWGVAGNLLGSYTAAMDGGGGYELYDHKSTITDQLIQSYTGKMSIALEAISDTESALGRVVMAGPVPAAAAVGGVPLAGADSIATDSPGALMRALPHAVNQVARDNKLSAHFHEPAVGYSPQAQSALMDFTHRDLDPTKMSYTQQDRRNLTGSPESLLFGVLNPAPLPGGSTAVLGTFSEGRGGDRTELRASPAERGGNGFNGDLARSRALRAEDPAGHDRTVSLRRAAFLDMYQQEKIADYFDGVGRPVTAEVTNAQLYEYAVHERQKSDPGVRMDPRVAEVADSDPLLFIERMERWNAGRSPVGREAGSSYQFTELPTGITINLGSGDDGL